MAAQIQFENLKKEYGSFRNPLVLVEVEGTEIAKTKSGLMVGDIEVESTSGYEAGIASFVIYGAYNTNTCAFEYKRVKKYVMLGAQVSICIGYGTVVKEVFCGFISHVNFFFQEGENPGIRVNCMDIKGIMMANCYSKQLMAMSYSDGVQEIFNSQVYTEMKNRGVIKSLTIADTPDKNNTASAPGGSATDIAGTGGLSDLTSAGGGISGMLGSASGMSGSATDKTVEMVAESDYEFVVKAAKKYNYEFFVSAGNVYFRKAKNYKDVLMELSPATGMRNVDVEYNVTGLVGEVEVRSTDVGKASQITSSVKMKNKLSKGRYASRLINNSSMIYIDPTADSKKEAGYRAAYLAEDIAYRYGTLEAEFIGLPDLVVGRFVKLVDMGDPVNNLFYIVSVRHTLDSERGFITRITAKAAGLGGSYSGGSSSGGLLGGALGGVMDTVNSAMDAADDAFAQMDDLAGGATGILGQML